MTTLYDEIRELQGQVQRLQVALAFWLPGVPPNDPEIAERAGNDAMLLVGLEDAPDEKDAEELGWISKRPPP